MYSACYLFLKKLSINSLKARVVLALIATSLFATIIAVSCFSIYQYHQVKNKINLDIEKNINLVNEPLSEALWSFKEETVQFMVSGLTQLPFIAATEVTSETGEYYHAGEATHNIAYSKTLMYQGEHVGTINIWLNQVEINQSIFNYLAYIAIIYIISTLLISLLSIKLIDFMLSRHLSHIAKSLDNFSLDYSFSVNMQLSRNPIIKDELTDIVDNFNILREETHNYINAKQRYEKHLTYQANHDDLTGLANRRYGLEQLENKIKQLQATEQSATSETNTNPKFALMFIDLDGFKDINDTHHHLVGDEILKIVAERLNKLAKPYSAEVARIGGDEFMLTVDLHGEALANLATIIIHTLKAPYKVASDNLLLSCSIGLAMYPDDADTATSLIANADTAMFEAKSAGKSQFKTFSAKMFEDLVIKSKLKNALGSALQNNEISTYFQPIFSIEDSSILGFEALCRWHHPEFGQVRPDLFIALAEESGDIIAIDRFVLAETIKLLHSLEDVYPNLFGSINFSPLDFEQGDLIDFISNLLYQYPLNSTKLEIEVTERSMLNDSGNNIQTTLQELDKLGVKISIDDFGTGYSALSYVKHYRRYISKIKIDRLFVRDIVQDKADAALVVSIISMANGLNMKVVAEGIETDEQRSTLSRLGCQYGQGYLISKPLPYDDFIKILSA